LTDKLIYIVCGFKTGKDEPGQRVSECGEYLSGRVVIFLESGLMYSS